MNIYRNSSDIELTGKATCANELLEVAAETVKVLTALFPTNMKQKCVA